MFENIFKRVEKSPQRKDNYEAQERIGATIDTKALSKEMESSIFHNQRLVEALARLVIELEDNITEYDTVLSDDASGRLVSLFLKNIIDKKREEVEKGRAKIYFVASGRYSNKIKDSAIKKFIANKKDLLGKTLLITEYVETGRSIEFLMRALEQQNIDFDTATISMSSEPEYYNDFIQKAGIKYGEVGGIGRALYNKPGYSGVRKTPNRVSIHPKKAEKFNPERVRSVRRDIDTLSEELSKLIS